MFINLSLLRSSSPFKLTYSARKSSKDIQRYPVYFSTRARSLNSWNDYQTDLAVEAERDARRVIEKLSMFEYWWDDNEMSLTGSNFKNKNAKTKTPTEKFSSHPQYQKSAKTDSKRLNNSEKDEKLSMEGRLNHSSEDIGSVGKKSKILRAKEVNLYGGFEGDMKI